MPDKVSGNPKVFEEAHERKRGGRVEHEHEKHEHEKKHGKHHKKKHHRRHGGEVEGEMAHHRMDRPRRARGGHVGADKHPFSSAHHTSKPGKHAD